MSNDSEIDYSERRFDDKEDLKYQLEQDLLFVRSHQSIMIMLWDNVNDMFMFFCRILTTGYTCLLHT